MKRVLIILSIVLIFILLLGGIFIYINNSQIDEADVRKAISNYLYENKEKECNSNSLDDRIYGDDCEEYYKCYGDEYSKNVMGSYVNEIKNRLTDRGAKSSVRLSYEDVKIIPEIENNDQYSSFDINHKCFLQLYEGKGLVTSGNARDYFVTTSNKVFEKGSVQAESYCSNVHKVTDEQSCEEITDCLINAISSDMSSSEVTALANYIKSDDSRYYSAGFELYRGVHIIMDSNLNDFSEQCGNV
tara:strand:+ start:1982 stop:2713 length:732 start_codon:yes stop_codon:yes gene_type:complete